MTIEELIEALQKAEGPSRELDVRLHFTLHEQKRVISIKSINDCGDGHYSVEGINVSGQRCIYGDDIPLYTASVDAAMALSERVIPGCFYLVGKGKTRADEPLYGAQIMFGSNEVMGAGETDASSAIALVLATLKAKQVQP